MSFDRFKAVQKLVDVSELSASDAKKAQGLYEKLASLYVLQIPLKDAKSLSTDLRADLKVLIGDIFALADLKKLSRKWDPKKKLPADLSQSDLAAHLVALLDGKAAPTAAPARRSRSPQKEGGHLNKVAA